MGNFSQQLKALLRRNFLLKLRDKQATFHELFWPLYFVGILVMINALTYGSTPLVQPAIPSGGGRFNSTPLFSLLAGAMFGQTKGLAAAPNTSEVAAIMDQVVVYLNNVSVPFTYTLFPTQQAMEDAHRANPTNYTAGVSFTLHPGNSSVEYTIHTPHSAAVRSTRDIYAGQGECRQGAPLSQFGCTVNNYLYNGFAALQVAIDTALIKMQTNLTSTSLPNYLVEMMPKPESSGFSIISTISSIYFVLSYIPFVTTLTVYLVSEKEKKIKESMKMMGLNSMAFWTSWLVVYMTIIILESLVCIGISYAAGLFSKSNFFFYFITFLLYGLSLVNIAFIMTTFFDKARTAGAVAALATLCISALVLPISLLPADFPQAAQWALCLLSPVAFATSINQAAVLERSIGAQFSNVASEPANFPLLYPIIMLIIDDVLYLLLALYLDKVIPGAYGKNLPWYFCLSPSYWRGREETEGVAPMPIGNDNNLDNENVEKVPADLANKVAIRIQKIRKVFRQKRKDDVVALDDFSLDIYENQITALLGHNGAGKTTLINAITGLLSPTSGSATIFGRDITIDNDIADLRTMTGVCPQQDILFAKLSVRDHLKLFAGIKGIPEDQVDSQMEVIMEEVDLKDQENTYSEKLSGGQKRKLCVGIAMIGDPKVIFLDEPTSGMDPFSRRSIWALLKRKRHGKVIVLTTHFMDEADILADRKAIISKGKLRCAGSSLFLKNRYGVGYHLGLVTSLNCDSTQVTAKIEEHVPEAELIRSHAMELSYTLPLERVENFADLFSTLDNNSGTLGIQNYGISMTTLEEVFLKLREDEEAEEGGKSSNGVVKTSDLEVRMDATEVDMAPARQFTPSDYQLITGKELTKRRMKALLKLKYTNSARSGGLLFVRFIMPVIFMLAGILAMRAIQSGQTTGVNPLLELTPDLYLSPQQTLLYQNSTGSSLQELVAQFGILNVSSELGNLSVLPERITAKMLAVDVQGLTVSPQSVSGAFTALYNDSAIHSIPVLLNVLNNALYGLALQSSGESPSGRMIRLFTGPWPQLTNTVSAGANGGLLVLVGFALLGIPSSFASEVVRIREVKGRAQLRVSGVTSRVYWGTLFMYDWVMYMIPVTLMFILLAALQLQSLSSPGAMVSLLFVVLLYVPVTILVSYCGSFLFEKSETLDAAFPSMLNMAGILPYFCIWPVDAFAQATTAATALHYVFVIIDPMYTIMGALYWIEKVNRVAFYTGGGRQAAFGDYFVWSANISICYVVLPLQIIGWFILLQYLEIKSTGGDPSDLFRFGTSSKLKATDDGHSNPSFSKIPSDDNANDSDVLEEQRKVDMFLDNPAANAEPPAVVVQDLRKTFIKDTAACDCRRRKKAEKEKVAVKQVSLAVQQGEVFGLLGPNGAGKTTTMDVITSELAPTKGRIVVGGYDVQSSLSSAFQAMGYCPQIDPLFPLTTLREHLELYGTIQGLNDEDLQSVVNYFIEALEIEEHQDKKSPKLSGGTKRKVSFLISLLGNPKIVLMDEPSTGMDPGAKRFLWNTISSAFNDSSRGAILTTHSMEEADALCSRVGIMINGQLRCLGSTQHLKTKYGSGYMLDVKVKEDGNANDLEERLDQLDTFVHELFPSAAEAELIGNRVTYNIPKENVNSLAAVFTALEEGKTNAGIEEYTFSQSTLEQVFLRFARLQDDSGGGAESDIKKKSIKRQRSLNSPSPSSATQGPVRIEV
ncbi:cholesterol transporter ABCA5-like [Branchiostoma lanceolatum]|uniref:cholesterol transporter ABCA5-like n=1 Tax=Branchiostoma lanceolatum TaxID=7740 RepID=UPI003451CD16